MSKPKCSEHVVPEDIERASRRWRGKLSDTAVDASVFASSAPLTAQRLGHLATHWPAWTIISRRGRRERVANLSTPFRTIFFGVTVLVPGVRVDASVQKLLGRGMRQQYGQEEPHTETVRV